MMRGKNRTLGIRIRKKRTYVKDDPLKKGSEINETDEQTEDSAVPSCKAYLTQYSIDADFRKISFFLPVRSPRVSPCKEAPGKVDVLPLD